jgi:predicted RNA binding protein YcfA (HicA-like mRNA interferase family)
MPKLPSVKPRAVVRFLEQNGFALDHTSGSHHVFFDLLCGRNQIMLGYSSNENTRAF